MSSSSPPRRAKPRVLGAPAPWSRFYRRRWTDQKHPNSWISLSNKCKFQRAIIQIDNKFYRAFEDRYRGSREVIKQRLNVYVPFVQPLLNIYDDCQATDLGCGRGEWLELMSEVGFTARGVDLNEDMLKACLERGLSVETQDAIAALEHLPDESQMVVSAFHLAEHIPFDDLKELVKEAFRVLKPSGLLILETPNSENLVVGTSSFYLDPSHQRPLPVQLLSFLCEYTGFQRTKILRLQEDAALETASRISAHSRALRRKPGLCGCCAKAWCASTDRAF